MLRKKLPYLLVTLLIGLVIGCGSSNPLVEKAESNIKSQNPQVALDAANESIKTYPEDPLGYYYKGVALGDLATQKDPAERQSYYNRMNKALAKAEEMASKAEDTPDEIQRTSAVRNVAWQTEHNRGVQMVQNDSLKNTVEKPLSVSMQHLKNATIIQPDSALSWNVLSQVAGMNQNFSEAAQAKTQYIQMVPDTTVKPNGYMQLARYYYNLDNQQKVLETLEQAQTIYPTNQQIISNLADTYSRIGKSEKAISTTEKLVQQNPEDPKFHQVLGTQLYKKALNLSDTVSTNKEQIQKLKDEGGSEQMISDLGQENKKLNSQITELTNRAEKELKTTIEYDPENAAAYNTLGIIYQNKAKAKFDERNITEDNTKANKLNKEGEKFLRESMKYYEKATEIDPDNQDYWRSLFSIYTNLGMDKKAKEAMKKAGMN